MDIWRLFAVLLVFFTHVKNDPVAHTLHPLGLYGGEGVAIFFVLSGALVATSTWKPDITARSFAIARLSRLWSVVIPALLLTVVLDLIGRTFAPGVCRTVPNWTLDATGVWQALAPILFVNMIPHLAVSPGSNGPFWSLGTEAWCYLAFAVATFSRGTPRIVGLLAIAGVVGLLNLMLAPIWGMGVILAVGLRRPLSGAALWKIIFWTTLIVIPIWMRAKFVIMATHGLPAIVVEDYVPGLLVMANIFAFKQGRLRLPMVLAPALRAVIARSFSLYLIQAPVRYFLTAFFDSVGQNGIVRLILLVTLPPIGAAAFASQTELRRGALATWIKGRLEYGELAGRLFFARCRRILLP